MEESQYILKLLSSFKMECDVMNAYKLDKNVLESEYNIPLDITDIITICREYNKLGWKIQAQVEYILEFGVEDSIKNNFVKQESLLHIKDFLERICDNPYFRRRNRSSTRSYIFNFNLSR